MSIALSQLNIDEALRYMGCPPDQADPATRALAEDCAARLLEIARPRWTGRNSPWVLRRTACAWRAACSSQARP